MTIAEKTPLKSAEAAEIVDFEVPVNVRFAARGQRTEFSLVNMTAKVKTG